MSELPKWPTQPLDEHGEPLVAHGRLEAYERARADAAMERLRLLVDKASATLSEQRREFARGEIGDLDELEDVLTAIGPLPPEGA